MDLIILGLLMVQECTVYEMKKRIETNFTSMSSGSMGSIQASVKKLLEEKMISFEEYVEKSVNKKVYKITKKGKAHFLEGAAQPMEYKEKNMELSKFFFMGYAGRTKHIELLDAYIAELYTEKESLEKVRKTSRPPEEIDKTYIQMLRQKSGGLELIHGMEAEEAVEYLQGIAVFQQAALEFSIEKIEYEAHWFERFRDKLRKERS